MAHNHSTKLHATGSTNLWLALLLLVYKHVVHMHCNLQMQNMTNNVEELQQMVLNERKRADEERKRADEEKKKRIAAMWVWRRARSCTKDYLRMRQLYSMH